MALLVNSAKILREKNNANLIKIFERIKNDEHFLSYLMVPNIILIPKLKPKLDIKIRLKNPK